jgi:hypothetical protein
VRSGLQPAGHDRLVKNPRDFNAVRTTGRLRPAVHFDRAAILAEFLAEFTVRSTHAPDVAQMSARPYSKG